MKVFNVVMKVLLALAAVAGAVYIAATYGDKIAAWAKKLLNGCCCGCDCECGCDDCECECECCEEDAAVEVVEAAAEEAPATQETPAEAAATEADFEG